MVKEPVHANLSSSFVSLPHLKEMHRKTVLWDACTYQPTITQGKFRHRLLSRLVCWNVEKYHSQNISILNCVYSFYHCNKCSHPEVLTASSLFDCFFGAVVFWYCRWWCSCGHLHTVPCTIFLTCKTLTYRFRESNDRAHKTNMYTSSSYKM